MCWQGGSWREAHGPTWCHSSGCGVHSNGRGGFSRSLQLLRLPGVSCGCRLSLPTQLCAAAARMSCLHFLQSSAQPRQHPAPFSCRVADGLPEHSPALVSASTSQRMPQPRLYALFPTPHPQAPAFLSVRLIACPWVLNIGSPRTNLTRALDDDSDNTLATPVPFVQRCVFQGP